MAIEFGKHYKASVLVKEELQGSNIKRWELVCFVSDIMGRWKMLANKIKEKL